MGNKYAGPCSVCGINVPPMTGKVVKDGRRWVLFCLAHMDQAPASRGGSRSVVTRFSSGATVYRNAKGRCEDAPCCGCCS